MCMVLMPASFTQEEYSFDVLSEPLAWLTRCGACSIGCVVGSHSMLFDQVCVFIRPGCGVSSSLVFSYGRVSGTRSASVRDIECVFRSLGQAAYLVLISVSGKCNSNLKTRIMTFIYCPYNVHVTDQISSSSSSGSRRR